MRGTYKLSLESLVLLIPFGFYIFTLSILMGVGVRIRITECNAHSIKCILYISCASKTPVAVPVGLYERVFNTNGGWKGKKT